MDQIGPYAAQEPVKPDAVAKISARVETGRVDPQRVRPCPYPS
jgi:hypothetical protein